MEPPLILLPTRIDRVIIVAWNFRIIFRVSTVFFLNNGSSELQGARRHLTNYHSRLHDLSSQFNRSKSVHDHESIRSVGNDALWCAPMMDWNITFSLLNKWWLAPVKYSIGIWIWNAKKLRYNGNLWPYRSYRTPSARRRIFRTVELLVTCLTMT